MTKLKFSSVILTFLFSSLIAVSLVLPVKAQDNTSSDLGASTPKISNSLANPTLNVRIPGLNLRPATCTENAGKTECVTLWLADYIQALYQYGIGIIGIIAVITLMIGGIIWLTAGGNEQRVGDAKKWISGSLIGVLIAFSSYMILNFVNPALTALSPLKISYINNIELPDITLEEVVKNDVSPGTIQSKGQECYFSNFGSSESQVRGKLVSVTMFGKNLKVHELAANAFKKVNEELQGKTNYNFYDLGTFNWRTNVNDPSKQSLHSFGIAIDINPNENPNGNPCRWNLPQVVIDTFKNNGFRWGGNYRKTCDTMHFEWLGPCQK